MVRDRGVDVRFEMHNLPAETGSAIPEESQNGILDNQVVAESHRIMQVGPSGMGPMKSAS